MIPRLAILLLILSVVVSGCAQVTTVASPTITSPGVLTPYMTVTPSPTRALPTIQLTIPVTPSPTPTPFLYTVKNDDTMLGIAFQFGITLDELKAANPTVDPHFMGEGLQLVIPLSGATPEALPSPTAVPVVLGSPRCVRTGDGGAWCIVAIKNDLEESLENLSVWIGLLDDQGETFASQTAYAPLNILRPGDSMPLMAYFAPPLPDTFEPRSELLSALIVNGADERYLDPQVNIDQVVIDPDGSEATLSGNVLLPEGSTLSQLWLLAVAFDADGNILGMRKWKSAGETEFDFTVYSLAGAIDHIEVLAEARP
ncbi:MAG: hypothetical protein C3F13_09885 [Anaerolineales bacterium]|nr:MAG: hypothetical protein C3F13_09885 [Anaerolineales bacterium]